MEVFSKWTYTHSFSELEKICHAVGSKSTHVSLKIRNLAYFVLCCHQHEPLRFY